MSEELTIKQLDKLPKHKAKMAKRKSNLRQLLEKFDNDKMTIAEIQVVGEKTVKGLKIGIGRILSEDKRKDIEVLEALDGKALYLKRK